MSAWKIVLPMERRSKSTLRQVVSSGRRDLIGVRRASSTAAFNIRDGA